MHLNPAHRFQHRYILGKTGMGKSTCMLSLMLEDIERGDGVFYIDPHGEDADHLLGYIPEHRRRDVILFDPSQAGQSQPINVLENIAPDWRPFVATSMVDTFKSIWGYDGMSTPVMDQILYNATAALLDAPRTSLLGLYNILTDDMYRTKIQSHITDPIVRDFWAREFESLPPRERREMTRSTLNKIGLLMSDPRVRATLGKAKSAIDLPGILDGKIMIAKLPQGRLGLSKTRILGGILLARLHAAALAREGRRPFHIYLDECHHFGTGTLIEMLSGIRKFGVSLTLCHQYLDQLPIPLRQAVLGSVGTKIVFRVGLADAEALRHELPVNSVMSSVAETQPYQARVVTPDGEYMAAELPTLPNERCEAMAARIRRWSQRHYARSE